jgi:putative endopeptidase
MVKQSALFLILILSSLPAQGAQINQDPAFPYTPSLDLTAMNKSVDACVDFYQYACGGWQRNNPIPPDQTSWDVYRKLYEDNLKYLRSILEEAASLEAKADAVTRQIGDFYTACMDELTVEKRGLAPLKTDLNAVSRLRSERQLAQIVGRLQMSYGSAILFRQGSTQDPDNSEQQIAELDQGGLGLPDRDYYTKDDEKSKEIQARYVQHIERVFELMGDDAGAAKRNANIIMTLETLLAKASMTRVDRRDPYKLKHKMNVADVEARTEV